MAALAATGFLVVVILFLVGLQILLWRHQQKLYKILKDDIKKMGSNGS